jgi:hypothetical protein
MLKEKSRKHKQFFPMIAAIMRKLTAAMKTIHADDKKQYAETTHQ